MPSAQTLSVRPSIHMTDLLNDTTLCKNIAIVHDDLAKILFQIQLDITNEDNRDKVGPTNLALKHVQDILLTFGTKGKALIETENKTKTHAKTIDK